MSRPYLWLGLAIIFFSSSRNTLSKPIGNELIKVSVHVNRTTTTEIPVFDRNKISLAVPDALFGPTFQAANTVSTIIGNLMQNTALRIAALIEGLKPIFRSSVGYHSKKREVLIDGVATDLTEDGISNNVQNEIKTEATDLEKSASPVKNSFRALTEVKR
uniref:Uncharacterized protein n=1 Tax=Cacopsylla melanoneura TaxID=428564 RepID=A0A8D8THQ1_9HEMI